jgi:peptidoglycan/LPS O-acetylase OafA/YrhL
MCWVKRGRRLLPAVIVLVAGVLAWAAWVLGDDSYVGDGIASLLYVQNWHQIFTEASYFEAVTRPSPLQHLWSLAIEEQFYLVWPALLLGVAWWCSRTGLGLRPALATAFVAVAIWWAVFLGALGRGIVRRPAVETVAGVRSGWKVEST